MTSSQDSSPTSVAPGASDPHSYANLTQGRIEHVSLELTVDFASKQLSGTARLQIADAQSGPLDLDTRDLNIARITDDQGRALEFAYSPKDAVLGQRLRIERLSATQSIEIAYTTSAEASSLQWLPPEQTFGLKHPFLFSQNQAIHARSMVPIQDTPAVRATYEASITVPKPLIAVMSAAPGTARSEPSAETSVFEFVMPQAIPAYLMTLVVGNIDWRDLGPRSRVYSEPEMLEASVQEFTGVEEMMQTGESLFGPYLWDRFDFMVMPASFPYGGMENARLTLLSPSTVTGDGSGRNVLAHELAHSWTGNTVTNTNMEHFWLNEGFTTYAEYRISEALNGREVMMLEAAIGRSDLLDTLKRKGNDWEYSKLRTQMLGADPDEVYSSVPYEKGFAFLARLEQAVGRESFDAFVKTYIASHTFKSITTEDFVVFLTEYFPDIGKQVDINTWLYETGLPDDAPKFQSDALARIRTTAEAFSKGTRPNTAELNKWTSKQWQVFLHSLPQTLAAADLKWMDETFGLTKKTNAEILAPWLVRGIMSDYAPALRRSREFLGQIGRMKFLDPIYRALRSNRKTQAIAREIFAAFAPSYHPVARDGIERILEG